MLLRRFRTYLFAARQFSTRATAEESAKTSGSAAVTSPRGGRDTLGRRLLSLVYPKRSAVIAINKWREEGHTARKYELNRIVRELRKLKRYKHALEVVSANFSVMWYSLVTAFHMLIYGVEFSSNYVFTIDSLIKLKKLLSGNLHL